MMRMGRTGLRLVCAAGLLAVCLTATTARGDFYLERRISLGSYFGDLGNNPFTVTFDGTYAYVGGYSGDPNPPPATRDIGILKINVTNPADATVLAAGTQAVYQFRYYDGMVVRDGILYALTDRPEGSTSDTNARAIDVSTGALVATFDGDFGDGDGIVYEPAILGAPALGGLAFDPGVGGVDFGLSLLAYGAGRRALMDIADGTTIYTTAPEDGMVVADIVSTCGVSDLSAWRDHIYDDSGDVYMRRSNQVQRANRIGPNEIGSYGHLSDELFADGTPKDGCGDGQPVAVRVASGIAGQHLELVPGSSAGVNEDLIIFNDRYNNAEKGFAEVVKLINTNGALPSPAVEFFMDDGTPLNSNGAPDGIGLYDFQYDAAGDRLLILDFSNRSLLVFSGTQPCNSPAQDSDGDGDVDVSDWVAFEECLSGPGQTWPGPPVDQQHCDCVDRGGDNDVDLIDLWLLQQAFTGSQ